MTPPASGPEPSRDPAGERPPRLLGPGFWLILAFGFVCVLAGAAVWALAWAPSPLGERSQSR
jgi:hypothetical protein